MYQELENATKFYRLIAEEKASFPIILNFNFLGNKKY